MSTIYMKYWTPKGYIVKVVEANGNPGQWKADTNDFSRVDHLNSFYHQYIADLKWKPRIEAQADLDEIARDLGLQEAGIEKPYSRILEPTV